VYLIESVYFFVVVIYIFAQYVIISTDHPCFAPPLTFIIQKTLFYPADFSCDVTVFVLNNVMPDQFDDVRVCVHIAS
jgi:hypothetical protein